MLFAYVGCQCMACQPDLQILKDHRFLKTKSPWVNWDHMSVVSVHLLCWLSSVLLFCHSLSVGVG